MTVPDAVLEFRAAGVIAMSRYGLVLASVVTVCALSLLQAEPHAKPAAPGGEKSRKAFEHLKNLSGDWEGKSTKGWTERISYRVIAGGSCLMDLSYGAHPNEWMASMIHMDGDRLMLTHYCVAKNQPRLVATEIADDLSSISFTYLDATNLPSRDKGHMDKCLIRFDGKDKFFSRWTWYQDGKESWMEDIEHRRIKGEAVKDPLTPSDAGK